MNVSVMIAIFWDLMPCNLVDRYQCFGESSVSIIREKSKHTLMMEAVGSSKMLACIYHRAQGHIPKDHDLNIIALRVSYLIVSVSRTEITDEQSFREMTFRLTTRWQLQKLGRDCQ
jgi:hypothetical protein